jgi:DNA mismatch repair protein MSH6
MAKLADESESFKGRTISGLLRSAPDLLPHIRNVQSMYQATEDESEQIPRPFFGVLLTKCPCAAEADELIPRPGKDENFDEVVDEIDSLEKSLNADLKKFEKALG